MPGKFTLATYESLRYVSPSLYDYVCSHPLLHRLTKVSFGLRQSSSRDSPDRDRRPHYTDTTIANRDTSPLMNR